MYEVKGNKQVKKQKLLLYTISSMCTFQRSNYVKHRIQISAILCIIQFDICINLIFLLLKFYN